jgi:molybdopterin converting factor small subunit
MIRETAGESALELAAKRLDRALSALEQRLAQGGPKTQAAAASAAPGDLFDQEQAQQRLSAELDRARARERELEAAGAEASAALGRAIDEIRAALNAPAAAEG